jgi:hypothetical protein
MKTLFCRLYVANCYFTPQGRRKGLSGVDREAQGDSEGSVLAVGDKKPVEFRNVGDALRLGEAR